MTFRKPLPRILTVALAALAAVMLASPVVSRPLYRITGTLQLPGEGGWDDMTFDPAGHRLFIAHGSRVDVVDTDRLARTGEIADTPGVHGIALAPELGRGYVSAGAASTIVVFDLKTLARLKDIESTGENPDAIVYDPATRRVFAFNGRGRNATVIDAVSNEVVGTIPLDAKPEFARVDGQGRVYVNLEDKNSLAVIDARTLSVLAVWPITGCEEPSGLALNAGAKQLFAVCGSQVMAVMDATSGQLLGTAPIGGGVDGAGYDPGARLAFASCGDGVLMVIAQDASGAPKVAQSLPTQPGARTMALDERTHRIFLVTSDFGDAPVPTPEHPHPRRSIVPGTFRLLVVGRFADKITTGTEGRSP
jgi:DNA-binding beta-propeller fold protein YncE